jgi:hypothetical protein
VEWLLLRLLLLLKSDFAGEVEDAAAQVSES